MDRADFIVDRAVARSPTIRRRLGTVRSATASGTATVLVDQATNSASTITASNAAGYLLAGDRVWVDFVAPKGAVIIGRVPDNPIILGTTRQFGPGWGPGSSVYGPVTIRRNANGEVHMTGTATRTSGAGLVVTTLPGQLRPAYDRRFPVWSATTIDLLYIDATSGQVVWAGSDPTDVNLDAIWAPKVGG